MHSSRCKLKYLQYFSHIFLPTVLTFSHRLKQIGFRRRCNVDPRFGSSGKFNLY
jgi:hypothetical protein